MIPESEPPHPEKSETAVGIAYPLKDGNYRRVRSRHPLLWKVCGIRLPAAGRSQTAVSLGGGKRFRPGRPVCLPPSCRWRKNALTSSFSQQCRPPILKLLGSQSTPLRIPSRIDASVRPSILAKPSTFMTSVSSATGHLNPDGSDFVHAMRLSRHALL